MRERDLFYMPILGAGGQHPAITLRVVQDRSKGVLIFGTGSGPSTPMYQAEPYVEVLPRPELNGRILDFYKVTYFYARNVRWAMANALDPTGRRCPLDLFVRLLKLAEQYALIKPSAAIPVPAPP